MKCDTDVRRDLFSSIVLSGGTTLIEGIAKRLLNEVTQLVPATNKVQVLQPADRLFSVWIGGSILASLSTYQPLWINKSDYEEVGGP